ncbi:porin [Oryzibacter oryziterrae]|uniref:porin n=1 Tax=Oryzibacter oryziterrae TaxID=2766474 RepID=UPI001F2DD4E1|nr:porin [Oryzibacter oryziterrae]
MKSILLGTAAGLMVASGAYAADLPGEPAPAAVDYVKVCDAYGAGFFYIPGTQTCMEIGGRVRSWVQYNTQKTGDDTLKFGADGRIFVDTRTASDFGTVRSYFRFKSGSTAKDVRVYEGDLDGSGTVNAADYSVTHTGSTHDVVLDQAYLQVGMLTIGYAGSFYGDGYIDYADDGYSIGQDKTRLRAQIVASDLGGGFFAGVGLYVRPDVLEADALTDNALGVEGKVGIAGQSWGSAELDAYWEDASGTEPDTWTNGKDVYGVKASVTFKATDALEVSAKAGYIVEGNDKTTRLGLAASYALNDATSLYGGVGYSINDKADNEWAARLGATYSLAEKTTLLGEVGYNETNDAFYALTKLTKEF